MANAGLEQVRASWEYFGETDPLWGVYSRRSARNNGWDPAEFFQTGRAEVADLMTRVARHLPGLAHGDAVDFGCGVGRLTQPLAGHFAHVTGVDIALPMLAKAREFDPPANIGWLHNTAPDLTALPAASADFVLAHIVFQHMPPALTFGYVADMYRVLRPGGGLVFTQPAMPDPTRLGGLAHAILPQRIVFGARRLRDKAVMEMHPIRPTAMAEHLEKCGFEICSLEPSSSASRNWVGFRYFVRKPGA
jgi:SAM-dependent methyltransferase